MGVNEQNALKNGKFQCPFRPSLFDVMVQEKNGMIFSSGLVGKIK